jgi:uracil-DNA glycosylase family 4
VIIEEYENCERCPDLCKMRTQIVWGSGNEECDLLFVAEAPGREEDLHGKPFVGASGDLLHQFLEEAGLTRSEVYITNTCMCRPTRPGQQGDLINRPPTSVEISHCQPRLFQEIVKIDPVLIVALGDIAVWALRGKRGIKKTRGNVVDIKIRTENDVVVTYAMLPVFHPSYHLRTQSEEEIYQTVLDLKMAKDVADRYKASVGTTRM